MAAQGDLPPATSRSRSRLGMLLSALGLVAVVLVAADAPPAVRAPTVLLAALGLPGYPVVARLPVTLPALVALDIATSLAIVAGLSLVMVELEVWHPQLLGLLLAAGGTGGTMVTLTLLRHAEARHLSGPTTGRR